MTQRDFLERLATLAKLCDFELSKDMVRLYDISLGRLGYPLATKAVEIAIVRRRGTDRMPSIADLVQLVRPKEEDIDTAEEVAGRIVDAVSRIGYYRTSEAMAQIGEIGEYVVRRCGGWQSICETMTLVNTPTMRAQFRGMALSAIRRNKAGTLKLTPSFKQETPELAAGIAALVKGVAKEVDNGGTENGTTGDRPGDARAIPSTPGVGVQRGQGDSAKPEALPPPLHPRKPA